jgi:hypothetical protein
MTASQRNGKAKAEPDPYLHDILLVDQLPSDAWAEGLALRPNGDALVSRVDQPELFTIELASATRTNGVGSDDNEFDTLRPRTIHTFDDANGVFDVRRLPGGSRAKGEEEYAVLSGFADFANPGAASFHTFVLWRVVLEPGGDGVPSQVSKIAELPDAGVPVGLEPFGSLILLADTGKGCIWKIHVPTGKVSVFLEDPTMQPHDGDAFGVNRIKVRGGYLWYTNTGMGTLSRVPVKSSEDDIQPIGPVEPIADGLSNAADGLVMFDDARAAYIVSYALGILWRIDIDDAGKGTVNVLREDLLSPTAMQLVYPKEGGKPSLYILCCGAVQESRLDTSIGRWFDLARVTDELRIVVTVTTEVT